MSVTAPGDIGVDDNWLTLGGYELTSRLLVGIEQYTSPTMVRQVLEVTNSQVFITTVDPDNNRPSLLLSDLADELPMDRYLWIGTTSFARSGSSALRTAHILRDSYGIELLKLDVRDDGNMPDNRATVEIAATLRDQGFSVLPFILPDEQDAAALESLGCSALRVMAAPVASGRGIPDPGPIRRIIDGVGIPVVVEGGLGTARHVTLAMEMGASAVLVNTALVEARQPLLMAASMRSAVEAGRLAYLSGGMPGDEISTGLSGAVG
ncbi:thiamine biosynthesis protein ThiG [Solwaraspora sp. WMMD937]|uniref:thiamine biosynthesis protein ThiG n=1 Tax=Solwaraspora sp. WMMD937 TaxID=3016090 RepID=UPI00249B6362|nr:thiamine biosynthesis protein ThiG [Solwaraspora sp. WMMD937]WFE20058.1 thiamine biosynthesis protein ThiG [Solwaraspora sp. WMMD937]